MFSFTTYNNTQTNKDILVTSFNRNGSSFCKEIINFFDDHGIPSSLIQFNPQIDTNQPFPQTLASKSKWFHKTEPTLSNRHDVTALWALKKDYQHNHVHLFRNPMHRYISGLSVWNSVYNVLEDEIGIECMAEVVDVVAKHNTKFSRSLDTLINKIPESTFDRDSKIFTPDLP